MSKGTFSFLMLLSAILLAAAVAFQVIEMKTLFVF